MLPPVVAPPPRAFRLLAGLTRLIPPLPHASGISNRIVKPLWCRNHKERYRVEVWKGIEMIIDPADGIGGNLAFIPHLFDAWEREAIRESVPSGGTFVDIGANIGSYALWAALQVGPRGRVLAYEAEPTNFAALVENIALNRFEQISARQVGVSDRSEILRLKLNPNGNCGGHSFVPGVHQDSTEEVEVQCEPLAGLLETSGVATIDFMKLDIEGFEQRVLSKFFSDVPPSSALRPKRILTEMFFGYGKQPGTLWDAIVSAGYKLERQGKTNALFVRV
jgi:FkbM family methyltransferase